MWNYSGDDEPVQTSCRCASPPRAMLEDTTAAADAVDLPDVLGAASSIADGGPRTSYALLPERRRARRKAVRWCLPSTLRRPRPRARVDGPLITDGQDKEFAWPPCCANRSKKRTARGARQCRLRQIPSAAASANRLIRHALRQTQFWRSATTGLIVPGENAFRRAGQRILQPAGGVATWDFEQARWDRPRMICELHLPGTEAAR
ncbi:MAG: hypothetical protein ACLT1W_15795 [Alistipes onderdonkii]